MTVTPQSAAELLVNWLQADAYQATLRILGEILQQGPPGRHPRDLYVSLYRWFLGLAPSDKEQVQALVAETARAAVFECLTVLDGSGPVLPGRVSDFAVYLQLYADEDAQARNQPEAAIRLNSPAGPGPYLHEIFS